MICDPQLLTTPSAIHNSASSVSLCKAHSFSSCSCLIDQQRMQRRRGGEREDPLVDINNQPTTGGLVMLPRQQ
ncbi:DNA replication complex GINS protein [Trichinella spiralis]|uniref:DNA replication complex GINS protein n=1 Tax=Trichinella spiralis TaxID=6334 RepID=A0ABR3K966_TRISP